MSVTSGFFNSVNHDRVYDAVDFSRIFDGIISDGVYAHIGAAFAVTAYTGMAVTVGAGRAWFNSTWTLNDDTIIKNIEDADLAYNRWDAIALEVNQNTRANDIVVVKGEPNQNAAWNDDGSYYPAMSQSEGVYQYPLAYILVEAQTVEVNPARIRNRVGEDECPFVTGILESTTIEALWQNWEQQFMEWFDRMKGQLSTDAAGHLQIEVDELDANKANKDSFVSSTLSASGWSGTTYSFESTYPSADYDILDVLPNESTNATQRKAFLAADIGGYYTTNIIKANGTVPSVDIPVTLMIRPK